MMRASEPGARVAREFGRAMQALHARTGGDAASAAAVGRFAALAWRAADAGHVCVDVDDAAEREKLGVTLEGLLSRLRTAPAWQAQDARVRGELIEMASECAGWFVRCTGSAEGHNGWLRLRFHQLHVVTADWLETQRVLHNFLIRRADGTTAAERLFRATHGDLIEYLTARMPLPAMPRRRARRVESAAQRLNL